MGFTYAPGGGRIEFHSPKRAGKRFITFGVIWQQRPEWIYFGWEITYFGMYFDENDVVIYCGTFGGCTLAAEGRMDVLWVGNSVFWAIL